MNLKLTFVITFLSLTIANVCEVLEFTQSAVIGLTLGALLISIATCYDFLDKTEKKVSIILNSSGMIVMLIGLLVKPLSSVDTWLQSWDENTLLLLSLATLFASLYIADVKNTQDVNKIKELIVKLEAIKGDIWKN